VKSKPECSQHSTSKTICQWTPQHTAVAAPNHCPLLHGGRRQTVAISK